MLDRRITVRLNKDVVELLEELTGNNISKITREALELYKKQVKEEAL